MKEKAAVVLLLELAVRRSAPVTSGGSHHHLLALFTFTSIKQVDKFYLQVFLDWLLIES
jgi:hypothetical protein